MGFFFRECRRCGESKFLLSLNKNNLCPHCASIKNCKICGKNGGTWINSLSDAPKDFCLECAIYYNRVVPQKIRILNDCIELVENSKKFETKLSRCDLLLSIYSEFLVYEDAGTDTINPSPSEMISKYTPIRNQIMIDGAIDAVVKKRNKAQNAKTLPTKQKYTKQALDEIQKYIEDVVDPTKLLDLKQKLSDELNKIEKELETQPAKTKTKTSRKTSSSQLEPKAKSYGELTSITTDGANLVNGKQTWEHAEDKKHDLNCMKQCCAAEIKTMQKTGQPPVPFYFERVAILSRKQKLYQQEVDFCEGYIKILDELYKKISKNTADVRQGPRYKAIAKRLPKAKALLEK